MTTARRSFDQLTDADKEAMKTLHEAGNAGKRITSYSIPDLVRKLTGDDTLRGCDEQVKVYERLRTEKWIVVRNYDHAANTFYFGVSDRYLQELQLI